MQKRPWIQAAIDVEDIDLARKIAFMALDNGAEWLEVGTPLIYKYGHSAIGMLRKAVGNDVVLIADYKSPFAMLCAEQAAREGANYIMLYTTYYDYLIGHSIDLCRKVGIEPVFDLAVKQEDLTGCVEKLVSKGARYVFSRHYTTKGDNYSSTVKSNNMGFLNLPNRGYYLGITSDDLEEATDAVRLGADWITFGLVLRNPDPVICKQWIDTIHNVPRKKE